MDQLLIPAWPDAGRVIGLGRTRAYGLLAEDELQSVTLGRRRLVVAKSLTAFVDRLVAEQSLN